MPLPRPTRRWLRYSIRGLLLLTLLVAIGCGWLRVQVLRGQEQDRLVAELDKYRGRASTFEPTFIGRTLRKISPSAQAWGERMMGHGVLNEVSDVEIWGSDSEISPDQIIPRLQQLRGLQRVHVFTFTDDFRAQLAKDMPGIEVWIMSVKD